MADDLKARLGLPFCEGAEEVTLPVWAIDLMGEARDRIEALEREQEAHLATLEHMGDAVKRMQDAEARLSKAVEALRFYADKSNYEGYSATDPCGCCSSWYEPKIHIDGEDSGDIARKAIALIDGGRNG